MRKSLQLLVLSVLAGALLSGCGGGGSAPPPNGNGNGNPLPSVTSISPSSTTAGGAAFTLTVTGSNFVSGSVVKWNGSSRPTVFGGATSLTASISAADLAIAGTSHIAVTSPSPGGGSSGNVNFTINSEISNGAGLPGNGSDLAVNATTDLSEGDVSGVVVAGGVVMNRLDVRFASDATVAQVNSALGSIGAGIVSMSHGFTSVTVGVPQQSSVDGLQVLVAQLESSPGIHDAAIAQISDGEALFPNVNLEFNDMAAQVRHLMPTRFPAAWNLARTDVFGDPGTLQSGFCPLSPVPVIVFDNFAADTPPGFQGLFGLLQTANPPPSGVTGVQRLQHGYTVTQILGANSFGANPFSRSSGCMDLRLLQASQLGLTETQRTNNFVANLPAAGTKFIANFSQGYAGCVNTAQCAAPHDRLRRAKDRAYDALYWKEKTQSRWGDFLLINSAGNQHDEDSAAVYSGAGDSRFNSVYAMSQLSDATFGFVSNDTLWTPSANDQSRGFVSLKASSGEVAALAADVQAAGMQSQVADNVIVVGSTTSQTAGTELTQHVPGTAVAESTFSDSGPDVLAVGEDIFNVRGQNGTSFSAPEVAGLASFLWMISPDLQSQPVSITKRIIVSNTRSNKVIDAYATALALDGTTLSKIASPMRFALLDENRDGKFDEQDLDDFLSHFFVTTSGDISHAPIPATIADFSKFDLNGDGFTTAANRRERFDLDRVGSAQFGASNYSSDVHETIEGLDIHFDESALTDIEILCYYAYSPLYTGDSDARKNLMSGRCGISVLPATANLQPGQHQQFTVSLPNNDPVVWTVSGAGNTITNTGFVTAGTTPGTFTVTVTDVNSSNLSGTATITISAQDPCAALQGINKGLEVGIFDHAGGDEKDEAIGQTVSNDFSTPDSNESGTASYTSINLFIHDTNTGRDLPGGSAINASINDEISIVPTDPTLMGTPITVTGTVTVSASAQVSGDRANARLIFGVSMGGELVEPTAVISTLSGLNRGNISGETATASILTRFGDVLGPFFFMQVNAEYACDPTQERCPPDSPAGTGTAQLTANMQWGHLTVKDQNGNAVGFTQCSVSGFTY